MNTDGHGCVQSGGLVHLCSSVFIRGEFLSAAVASLNASIRVPLFVCFVAFVAFVVSSPLANAGETKMKTASAFYPKKLVQQARAAAIQKNIVRAAEPWRKMSNDHLWSLMFGNTIKRSWMVWSNGHCPACGKSVPMYTWKMDAIRRPWKVWCPHCKEVFPKNDFAAFYRSGLDEHGVFDPKKADRKLLFNTEHPDPKDPLHKWGVDDGEGFVWKRHRWRFIGAYLIYGQWKHAVLGGIKALSAAYVVTGDPVCARKAGILLDRVADLYPTFDFRREGVLYEGQGARGYVSTWHDACEEVRELALCYDRVFEGIRGDKELIAFLAKKAKQFRLPNAKATFADVQRNIEQRILRDTVRNRHKIRSNRPRTSVALLVINAVLGWPDNREAVLRSLDSIVRGHTRVDGVTGEKGLAGYSTIGPRSLALIIERFASMEPALLADLFKRRPDLRQTWRFHIDTWCLGQYYPQSGDTGAFAMKSPVYRGVDFARQGRGGVRGDLLEPSRFAFLWRLYEETRDPAYVQVMYLANGRKTDGLPHDIFAKDPAAFEKKAAAVINEHGTTIQLGSVNKRAWHLAILRSGKGVGRRALWLDYDSKHGNHSHYDGMNLGLFAKGLDLMPDLGYPPVQFGGWGGSRFSWYVSSASHNTVVVNGRSHSGVGKTTLWADGEGFRAIRASAPGMAGSKQFERTAALIDVSDRDFYVLDVFRVVGGVDHAKFFHSYFGEVTTDGLALKSAKKYGYGTLMSNFKTDPAPKPGWSVDWKIDDHYDYLPKDAVTHLRYADLTTGAAASVCKGWVMAGSYNSSEQKWIPRVMVRRTAAKAPLASTFVAVIEPYNKKDNITGIKRLTLETVKGALYPDANVAAEVSLADGRKDLLIAADVENPMKLKPSKGLNHVMVQKDWRLKTDAELCLIRRGKTGKVERVALCAGRSLHVGGFKLKLKQKAGYIEAAVVKGKAAVTAGDPACIETLSVGDKQ